MEPASGSHGVGGGGGSSSRWNPTKEQLSMLEGLYGQGIRTPSAEQIQSITKRLQIYGHIEGKNVFYWFQNHKARQRQKQKMDQINSANIINNNNNNVVVNHINNNVNAAYFNRFYYTPSPPVSPSVAAAAGGSHPLFQASPHNVANFSPYYIAQPEFAFYPHSCPKMALPNHILNTTQTPSHRHDVHHDIAAFAVQNSGNHVGINNGAYPSNGQVTLDLFPVHPTGILQHREQRSSSIGSSTENSLETRSDQDVTPAIQSFSSPYGVKFDVFSK